MTTTFDDDLAQLTSGGSAEQRPAAAGSALAEARRKRDSALGKAYLDLRVPDLPGFFVRFRAIEHAELTRVQRRHEKSKSDDKDLTVNATILSLCCLGVGQELDDGTKVSVDPEDGDDVSQWPRFDDRLARLLGVTAESSVDVVKALYGKDGWVFGVGAKLTEWSGYALNGIEEAVSGG